MQTAPPFYILRAIYKDDYVTDCCLTRPVTDILTNTLGAQWTNRYDRHISPLSRAAYTLLTLMRGQTLGDEFCDLLPVSRAPPALWATIGATRKIILAMIQAAKPSVVFWLARRLFHNVAPQDVEANLSKCFLCLLCLTATYGTLPHLITQIRFLSLKPSGVLAQDSGITAITIGLVLLVELIVRLRQYMKSRRAALEERTNRDGAVGEEESSENEDDEECGKCVLCLGYRKNPAVTQCGHAFCWRCVSEWIASNPKESLCPICRQRITSQSLVPLFFYASHAAPRLGEADRGSS